MWRKLNFNGKGSQSGPWAFRGPSGGPEREREQVLRLGGGPPYNVRPAVVGEPVWAGPGSAPGVPSPS